MKNIIKLTARVSLHEPDGFDGLLLALAISIVVPVLCIPNANAHVVTASQQDITILSDAGDRVFVAYHSAKVLACLQFVDLDLLSVSTNDQVPFLIIFIEVNT